MSFLTTSAFTEYLTFFELKVDTCQKCHDKIPVPKVVIFDMTNMCRDISYVNNQLINTGEQVTNDSQGFQSGVNVIPPPKGYKTLL